jgi:hypothetical protein
MAFLMMLDTFQSSYTSCVVGCGVIVLYFFSESGPKTILHLAVFFLERSIVFISAVLCTAVGAITTIEA